MSAKGEINIKRLMTLVLVVAGLAACTSSPRTDSIINGMQGERVNSLCFSRSINSWHELSPSSVILRVNRNDYYRVDLIGTCRPENAFSTISIQSRNGMCLAAGDTISFDNDFAADSCSVTNIYHWIPAPVDEIVTN